MSSFTTVLEERRSVQLDYRYSKFGDFIYEMDFMFL